MGKNKALAHLSSTYFHTRGVLINSVVLICHIDILVHVRDQPSSLEDLSRPETLSP